jgi:adenine-specific DNA-methyltransferase
VTKAEQEPQPKPQQLEDLLLGLLPANGSTVANGPLLALWLQAAASAGLQATADDFTNLRTALLARGLVVKGKGRGGATARASAAAPGSEAFTLEGQAAATAAEEAGAAVRPAAPAKPGAKPRLRAADADEAAQVLSYRHADRRVNNPEVGLVNEASDPQQPKQAWAYNPHLDPVLNFDSARAGLENLIDEALASGDAEVARAALQEIKRRGAPYLQWAGKAERTSFEVDTVSLHVHERIDPMSILSAVRKQMEEAKTKKAKGEDASALGRQASLFEAPFESLPLRAAVDFYRHDKGWANRLIAGDSLQVMNSLLVKEGMAGQVQMIYIDPPYGIKYGSNFQPFVSKKRSEDRNDADLTAEPEMIKAFRDTWELGIHSYLTYLRDRLLLAKQLLNDTGSVFVQISDENLHHVRELMDEVFGAGNWCGEIRAIKTSGQTDEKLATVTDNLIWFAKNKESVKFYRMFEEKAVGFDEVGQYYYSTVSHQ